MRSPKNRLSIQYCVQTWRSSVGMFCTMSSAVAQRMYFAVLAWCSEMPAERMSLLEELDRVGDLLHQARERGAHERDAQPTEQQQQRPGARMIGLAFGATSSSTRNGGPGGGMGCGAWAGAGVDIHSSRDGWPARRRSSSPAGQEKMTAVAPARR